MDCKKNFSLFQLALMNLVDTLKIHSMHIPMQNCKNFLFTFSSKFNLFQTCLSSSLLVHCWRGTSCVIAWHRWSNCNSGFAFAISNSVDYTKCYARWSDISLSLSYILFKLALVKLVSKNLEIKCANLLWSDIAVLFPCASWEPAKDWFTKFTLTQPMWLSIYCL